MATKIQDLNEARRWLQEGKTYAWIVEEYKRKYNIETALSTWSMLRRREGIPRRIVRDEELMPWAVKKEHRYSNPAAMLRAEARRRAGQPLSPKIEKALDSWLATLQHENAVVHYDPERGWLYVPRREGIDTDLVRVPRRATGRPNAND